MGFGAAFLVIRSAFGQDLAVAEAQFNRGLEEMEAGRYETGCPALAESQRLDPRAGTLFTLADCEAKRGHIATAMTLYEDYLAWFGRMTSEQQAKQQGRETIVAERKAELAAKVPKLTLVPPANRPPGFAVKRDDVALAAPSLGIALPVDPGEHLIVVEAPGFERRELRVTVRAGEATKLDLLLGKALPPPTPESTRGIARVHGAPADRGPSARRVGAYIVGGVGVAGIAVGAVTGGLTLGKKAEIDEGCVEGVCDDDGFAATESANGLGLASTLGFAIGSAAVGAAVVLILTEPSDEDDGSSPTVALQADGLSLGMRGRF